VARRPQVFAHRGGSALAPENTIAAFDRGLAAGADGLELDVHLSRDGVVVVHHDRLLDRTTNLAGPIELRTADELTRADAGYNFRPLPPGPGGSVGRRAGPDAGGDAPAPEVANAFPFRGQDVGIPTLSTVLARYRDVPIVIELKMNDVALAVAVVETVRSARAVERVCCGSFGLRVLREVRRLEPRMATSAAREEVRWAFYRSRWRWPVRRTRYDGYQVPEWSGGTHVASKRFVEDARRAGLAVQVWTVDTEGDADRLLDVGVQGLITDRPDVIVPLVRRLTGRPLDASAGGHAPSMSPSARSG
jgi:glycerophosphoryl diester phosphodiesterase